MNKIDGKSSDFYGKATASPQMERDMKRDDHPNSIIAKVFPMQKASPSKIKQKKIRLAFADVAPYAPKLAFYDAVDSQMDCCVFFSCKYPVSHPSWNMDEILSRTRFQYKILRGAKIRGTYIRPVLLWHLYRYKPHVIVAGSFFIQSLFALIYARLFGSKILILSNITKHVGAMRPSRKWFRKWLVQRCDGFIAASSDTRRYFCELGAKRNKVFVSNQTIDIIGWKELVDKQREFKDDLKREHRLNDRVILYVGRLEPIKGVDLLLEAFHQIAKTMENVSILLVGDGSEIVRLKEYCEQRDLLDKVIFTGYKQPDEIPKYYAMADLFVFPTLGDTFGLVVNEAIGGGLAVICSPFAGAVDLIQEGKNGYIVNPHNVDKMASLLSRILTNDSLLQKLNQGALASIEEFTVEKSVEKCLRAVESVLRN